MKNKSFITILIIAVVAAGAVLVFSMLSRRQDDALRAAVSDIMGLNAAVDADFNEVSALLADWLGFKADSLAVYRGLKARRRGYDQLLERAHAIAAGDARAAELKKLLISKIYHLYNLNLGISECCRSILWGPLGSEGLECNSVTAKMPGSRYKSRDDEFRKALAALDRESVGARLKSMLSGSGKPETKPASEKKNVIFILIDTLRADHLGGGGCDKGTSPFMDRLAREGVLFRRCYSQAPTTVISVPSILTGVYPYTHGLFPGTYWDHEKLLAPQFKKSGYSTAGISANTLISPANKFDLGFDYFETYNWSDSRFLNNNALNWLETYRPAGRPFFLYLHYIDPHSTYFSPDDFNDEHQKPPRELVNGHPLGLRRKYQDKGLDPLDFMTRGDVDYLIELYDGEIKFIDSQLAALFGQLEAGGFLENTIVVITSDHGEEFLEHGNFVHSRSVHEELIHVPLIIWGAVEPHAPRGTIVDFPVETVDALPTIMKWVGVPVPEYVQGGDLMAPSPFTGGVPVFSITPMGWSFEKLTEDNLHMTASDGVNKLIFRETENIVELYNLESDPGEKKNLAGRDDPNEARLMSALRDWAAKTKSATSAGSPGRVNPALNKQLKDLGYIQ